MSPAPKYSPQEQELMILSAAAKVIEASSLLDFTMSSVAKEAGLSMGSIYKHVQTKDDVLIALATEVHKNLFLIFERIFSLPVTTPEKLIGCMLLDYQKISLYTFDCHLDMLVSNEAILKRASPGWVAKMVAAEEALERICYEQIEQAARRQELDVHAGGCPADEDGLCVELADLAAALGISHDEMLLRTSVNELNVGLWAMNVGSVQVALQKKAFTDDSVSSALPLPASVECASIKNAVRFINSFCWQTPLNREGVDRVCQLMQEQGLR